MGHHKYSLTITKDSSMQVSYMLGLNFYVTQMINRVFINFRKHFVPLRVILPS